MANSNYMTQITLPDGYIYEVRDAEAQEKIGQLIDRTDRILHYKGTSVTELTDGYAGNVTLSDGTVITNLTAMIGDLVVYTKNANVPAGHPTGPREFIYDGSKWRELGSTGVLRSMAYTDTAEGFYTPAGQISTPIFTGTALTATGEFTPAGQIVITTRTDDPTNNYIPQGTISTPAVTVNPMRSSVRSIAEDGVLPSCKMPVFSSHVDNQTLTLEWEDGLFDAGALPVIESKNVMTDVDVGVSQPQFNGTPAHLHAEFSGTRATLSVTGTPQGTVSTPSFNGIKAKIVVAPTITVTPN